MIEMRLHPNWERHTGHCQITYTSKNHLGQTLIYCLQERGKGDFHILRCSQDFEPSHTVRFKVPVKFERPKGDYRIVTDVNKWIDSYEEDLRR